MFKKLRDFLVMKKNRKSIDLKKEEFRGTLKQIMKVRGLRTISLKNYQEWKGQPIDTGGIHSVKLDIMSGYINLFGYDFAKRSGKPICSNVAIEDAPAGVYQNVYSQVVDILKEEAEGNIPSKVKKNILVKVTR